MLQIFVISGLISLGLIGWVALLSFPWDWFLIGFIVLQLLFWSFVLYCEYSALSVSGASGWVFVFFCFVEGFAALILGVLRLGIFIGQVFNWIVF